MPAMKSATTRPPAAQAQPSVEAIERKLQSVPTASADPARQAVLDKMGVIERELHAIQHVHFVRMDKLRRERDELQRRLSDAGDARALQARHDKVRANYAGDVAHLEALRAAAENAARRLTEAQAEHKLEPKDLPNVRERLSVLKAEVATLEAGARAVGDADVRVRQVAVEIAKVESAASAALAELSSIESGAQEFREKTQARIAELEAALATEPDHRARRRELLDAGAKLAVSIGLPENSVR